MDTVVCNLDFYSFI